MDQTAAKAELVTLIADTLQQVTDERLTAAITEAWRDGWVATPVWDSTSLTFSVSVYQYPVPTGMTTVDAIYIRRATSAFPEEISSDLWEVVDGNIIFQQEGSYIIPDGFALQVRGKYKLTDSDSIPSDNLTMQNYVVALAGWHILKYMTYTKILSFLNNDTSVSEILAFKADIQRDVQRYRQQLQMSYVNG